MSDSTASAVFGGLRQRGAGRAFAQAVSELDATIVRSRREDEPACDPPLAPIRQRIERSSTKTCSPSNATAPATLNGIKERILQRFLCLAGCITLNHQLGRPPRALVDYVA